MSVETEPGSQHLTQFPEQSHCFALGQRLVIVLNTHFRHLTVYSSGAWGLSCALFLRLRLKKNLPRLGRTRGGRRTRAAVEAEAV